MSAVMLTGAGVFLPALRRRDEQASVLVRDGRIVAVGDVAAGDAAGAEVVDLAGKTILPGLVDMHHHFTMYRQWGPMSAQVRLSDELLVIRGVRAALSALREGFTTVRECGAQNGCNLFVKRAIDGGAIPGPRSQAAGAPIGVPGGHVWQVTPQVSGKAAWVREVRRQIRDGVDWIKIFASDEGPWGDPADPASYSRADAGAKELKAAVRAAHDMRTPVVVHANHPDAIERSLDAGADTIEHGMFLSAEQAARMAESGAALVPTLSVYRQAAVERWGRGAVSREMNEPLWESHMRAVATAIEAGVRIGVGTDSVGDVVEELELISQCGMSKPEALAALTLGNAGLLGLEDELGDIAEGYVADLVVVDGDPTTDLSALHAVTHVMQSGDLRAVADIGMRTGPETADWNTAALAR